MDIKVGEYVRTNRGYFYKIKKIRKSDVSEEVYIVRAHGDNYNFYLRKDNIRKHSKNIIDLIEREDIIEVYFPIKKTTIKIFMDEYFKDSMILQGLINGNIILKSILTHEQYNQNCYKLNTK